MRRAARRFHRRYWLVAGVALPLAFLAIVTLRQTVPVDAPAVLLEAPR